MLKRIHIKGYKSLHDLELNLGPLCVIFGPNAAGKSNFLDALQLLSRLVRSRTLTEAFAPPYRGTPLESFTFPEGGMKGLLSKETKRFSFEVDVQLSQQTINRVNRLVKEMKRTKSVKEEDGVYLDSAKSEHVREQYLRYRIEVEIAPKSGIMRVVDEHLEALTQKGEPRSGRNPFLEKVKDKLHLRIEKQSHPTYHDLYLDHSILSLPLYPPHYPHVVAMREEIANWGLFYFEPRERMRSANPVKEVTRLGMMGEDLAAYLNTLRATEDRQLKAIGKALHEVIPTVTGIDVDVSDLGEVELRIREGEALIPARVVSEGTLRILGLLALGSSKEPVSLVGFEEPENGVHPRRVRIIAELLKTLASVADSQLIVTTHSPTLLDLMSDESLYVCSRRNGTTEIKPFSVWGPLARKAGIDEALDELPMAEMLPVSKRILRGDFDA